MAKQSQETVNALVKKGMEDFVAGLNQLNDLVVDNDKTYYVVFVSKEEFALIKTLVLGFAGMILIAFAGAAIKLLFK